MSSDSVLTHQTLRPIVKMFPKSKHQKYNHKW